MGFATRPQLNRHTRKYHTQVDDGASLAGEVRALKKRRLAEETTRDQIRQLILFRPEEMLTLPDTYPAEEKRKWEVELRMLWEQIDKNPQASPQHKEAKGKLVEFSDALISKLRAPELSALFKQQQQIANRSAALTSTIPMSIPNSWDPVPRPLPPPRHLADISDGRSNRPDITYVSKGHPYSALTPVVTPLPPYDTRFRGNSFDATWVPTSVARNNVHALDRLGTPLSTQYEQ